MPSARNTPAERGEFGLVRERAGHFVAPAGVVGEDARRRHAERARLDTGAGDVDHRRDVVGRRDSGTRTRTHHVGAHRGVRHVRSDVDHPWATRHRVEVLGERLPLPVDAFPQCGARDVFDALHQLDELLLAARVHRREPHAAVAGDDGGDAVPARRPELRVPRRLPVVVRVHVDETGRDEQAVGVDRRAGGAVDSPDLDDAAVVDGDVGGERLTAQPVDDRPAPYHEIVHGRLPSSFRDSP